MRRNLPQLNKTEKLIEINRICARPEFLANPGRTVSPGLNGRIVGGLLGCVVLSCSSAVLAANSGQPMTIDDLGFTEVMNDNQFNSSFRIESHSLVNSLTGSRTNFQLNSIVDFDSPRAKFDRQGFVLDESALTEAQGFKVRRFSTAMESSHGVLTVGNDWSNFQDFLGSSGAGSGFSSLRQNSQTSDQIRWNSNNGFSVALENNIGNSVGLQADSDVISSGNYKSSPNLILSWNGTDPSSRAQYSFTALGRQLQLEGFEQKDNSSDELGWGLNLAGGWRFGDLFAALSVTLGNSIDNFILSRFGDSKPSEMRVITQNESININPSINYRLGETSNLRVEINRFESGSLDNSYGVDTLDTVHLGYTWNPWPSTRFGIEFIGTDVEGRSDLSDSNEVNFAASKRF